MTRTIITRNDVQSVPTIPIFVGFTENGQEKPFPQKEIQPALDKIFQGSNSMNAYYQEISYGRMSLVSEPYLSVCVGNPVSVYSWGFTPGEFSSEPPKQLALDVFKEVLKQNPAIRVQDRLIFLLLNTSTTEIQGRGAMCLVPGVTDQPLHKLPENQELFIGHLPLVHPQTMARGPFFIDSSYNFFAYYSQRQDEFNNGRDEFVRGICIFCNDAPLSCAVHDAIHGVKRISAGLPSGDYPGARGRAVPCLYNLFLQGHWLDAGCNRSVYCTPYVGWWDNTGDHLHPRLPRSFFSGTPYSVCTFTKMKLGILPQSYIGEAAGPTHSYSLARLSVSQLPPQVNGQPVLAVKVPLSSADEYLLIEHRSPAGQNADNITVDIMGILGNPLTDPHKENPPDHLVSDDGILIYHVNEGNSHLGGDTSSTRPSTDEAFVRSFLIFLYTPDMVTDSGEIQWGNRTPGSLKSAAFDSQHPFKMNYPVENPSERIEVHISEGNGDTAAITVTRVNL